MSVYQATVGVLIFGGLFFLLASYVWDGSKKVIKRELAWQKLRKSIRQGK